MNHPDLIEITTNNFFQNETLKELHTQFSKTQFSIHQKIFNKIN